MPEPGNRETTTHCPLIARVALVALLALPLIVGCPPSEGPGTDSSAKAPEPAGSSDPQDPGPGPAISGKIKKPGSTSGPYEFFIDRQSVPESELGDPGVLRADLSTQAIGAFNAKYDYKDGNATKTGVFEVQSATIEIDSDEDGTFDQQKGDVKLEITRYTCGSGECLQWKNLTSGAPFPSCYTDSSASPACKGQGIPPELVGRFVDGGMTIVRKDTGDPVPHGANPIHHVAFYFD